MACPAPRLWRTPSSKQAALQVQTVLFSTYIILWVEDRPSTLPTMSAPTGNPPVQADDELDVLLTDPTFVERTVTSDAFIDWNLELAINWRIHLPREEGARIFLQIHPHYTMELRDAHPTLLSTNLPIPPNLLDLWRIFMNSDWHRNNQHEPKVAGYSVLRQMLVQQPDSTDTETLWICGVPSPSQSNAICGRAFRRWDRGITHIRAKHLNHKPFPCDGLSCGVPTWCVIPDPVFCL